ncbi:hypothetical protein D3C81_1155370 [compost metagenome]
MPRVSLHQLSAVLLPGMLSAARVVMLMFSAAYGYTRSSAARITSASGSCATPSSVLKGTSTRRILARLATTGAASWLTCTPSLPTAVTRTRTPGKIQPDGRTALKLPLKL